MLLHRPWNTKNWIDWHPLPKVIFSSNEVHNVGKSLKKSHFKNAFLKPTKMAKKDWGRKKLGEVGFDFQSCFRKGT